jgi:hypothetical protein
LEDPGVDGDKTAIGIDTDIYLYSNNRKMETTFGYRAYHKAIYEGSMKTHNPT